MIIIGALIAIVGFVANLKIICEWVSPHNYYDEREVANEYFSLIKEFDSFGEAVTKRKKLSVFTQELSNLLKEYGKDQC